MPARPPTGLGRLSPWTARAILLALLALMGYGLSLTVNSALVDDPGQGEDPALYAAVVRDLRAGGDYYPVTAAHLRARGYAMASPFNYRLPTLAVLVSRLPSEAVARGLLGALAAAALATWILALRAYLRLPQLFLVATALLGLLLWPLVGQAHRIHETWAGVAITLSLGCFALGHGLAGMACALGALAVRELALPYVVLAILFAHRARARRELGLGLAGLALFVVAYLVHAWLVTQHAGQALGTRLPWVAWGGWRFVLKTSLTNVWLLLGPPWIAALAWPLALAGTFAIPGPLGPRVRALAFTYTAAYLIVGLPYNYLWGLLYVGPVLAGLGFAPTLLVDLCRQAFPRSIVRA